jgi:hypothetical protein
MGIGTLTQNGRSQSGRGLKKYSKDKKKGGANQEHDRSHPAITVSTFGHSPPTVKMRGASHLNNCYTRTHQFSRY